MGLTGFLLVTFGVRIFLFSEPRQTGLWKDLQQVIDLGGKGGYTFGMKTAVSIPDEVFEAAERLVEKLQTSRSQLYARALEEFLARHDENQVTHAINKVMDSLEEPVEPFVREAGKQALKRVEW